ncbi:hypothetical protein [Bacillus andreraoultii]|uniref:hypothetical protein n=1 Tax=Bacillus andreraoultii TaxID=1499685 RepID=UPI00053BA82D|nr:hypothetical protein [Bacillus andreraoultii]
MKTNLELCREAFQAINSFKRSRCLTQQYRKEGDELKSQYHELKMYKEFDRLELALRAIQKNERIVQYRQEHDDEHDEDEEDDDDDSEDNEVVEQEVEQEVH